MRARRAALAPGWTAEPYWWEAAPRERRGTPELPASTDVAVVGAGFTGLAAALTLARAGRSVVVLDARAPGEGASTRNGGMVGSGHRLAYADLVARHGETAAGALVKEGLNALEFTAALIEGERIACRFAHTGRFRAAWEASDYERIARDVEVQRRTFGVDVDMLPRPEQEREIVTPRYHGGCIYHRHGGLHPGLFHQGLLERARAAGVVVAGGTPVRGIERERAGLRLRTTRGAVVARNVVVATNGYTTRLTSRLKSRLAPVPSFVVATEPLGAERVRSLMPGGRMIVESRAAHCYYRPSPDGERILLGARAALHPISPQRAARRLRAYLVDLFPSLVEVRLTHSWSGFVAFTRQWLPALGEREGVHYALGYCGSGVAMAPYLGHKIAHRIIGSEEGRSAFDALPFQPWPFAAFMPLAMPAVSVWHRLKDLRESSAR